MENHRVTISFKAITTFNNHATTNVTNVKFTLFLKSKWWRVVAEAWWLNACWSGLETTFLKTLNNVGYLDNNLSALEQSKEETVTGATCHRFVDIE